MVEEYKYIVRNDVWEVITRPTDKSVIGSRWIFKVKKVAYESIEKYKAILVSKGTLKFKGLNMRRHLTLYQDSHPSDQFLL